MSAAVSLSRCVWAFFSFRVFLLSITDWPFCLLHRLPQSLSLALSVWAASQQSPPFFTSRFQEHPQKKVMSLLTKFENAVVLRSRAERVLGGLTFSSSQQYVDWSNANRWFMLSLGETRADGTSALLAPPCTSRFADACSVPRVLMHVLYCKPGYMETSKTKDQRKLA
jgi:hypothetical protein